MKLIKASDIFRLGELMAELRMSIDLATAKAILEKNQIADAEYDSWQFAAGGKE